MPYAQHGAGICALPLSEAGQCLYRPGAPAGSAGRRGDGICAHFQSGGQTLGADPLRRHGKEYLAVVHGCLPEQGVFEDYLYKDASRNLVKPVREGTPGAKYAKLEYTLEAARSRRSLVRIRLHTGRSHQIRVQFASRGYPLLGDARYGKGEPGRIALYSARIAFAHPVRGARMEFESTPVGGFFEEFTRIMPSESNPFL